MVQQNIYDNEVFFEKEIQMPKMLNESLIYEILSVVEEIPEGRVDMARFQWEL